MFRARRNLARVLPASWLLMVASGYAPLAASEILDVTLTIGEDSAVVREMRRFDLVPGEQDIYLEHIPAEADLSSLIIRTRRIPVDLLHWERMDRTETHALPVDDDALALTPSGVIRRPDTRQGTGPVRCRINFPIGGARSLEIVYRTRGLNWASHYQVYIRGEPDGLDERVALDLTGFVRIDNRTSRSFTNALVRLVGADPRRPREPPRQPGFLLLADSPITDLWKTPRFDYPPEFGYRLPRRANISSHTKTEVHFIQSHRIPSSRLYVMDSQHVPLSITGTFLPLQQYLVFDNTAANRLGWTLPPGPVEVFHGVTRRTVLPAGFLPHTAINREIRIDLGPTPDVRGMRRVRERTGVEHGFYEEVYRLAIESERPGRIAVEINERPPTGLSWNVQRASMEYEVERRRIRMRPELSGPETREIDLRLRFHQPTL